MGCGQSTRRVTPTSTGVSKENPKTLTKTNSSSADSTKPPDAKNTKKSSGPIQKKAPAKPCDAKLTQVTTDLDGEYENPKTPCNTTVRLMDNKWIYIKDGEVIKIEDKQPSEALTKPSPTTAKIVAVDSTQAAEMKAH